MTPDEIIDEIENAVGRGSVGDVWNAIELMWTDMLEVVGTAHDADPDLAPWVCSRIQDILADFLTNFYGD